MITCEVTFNIACEFTFAGLDRGRRQATPPVLAVAVLRNTFN